MITYQDLIAVGESDSKRIEFVKNVINKHKSSEMYRTARVAEDYRKGRNKTICDYQKLLYTVSGKAVPDNYSANYKLSSKFFKRFVVQEVQFLLGNGVTWGNDDTDDRLGVDFDTQLQKAAKDALAHGVAFGFMNFDHLDVFSLLEFATLYDEENGSLRAGVRFWQVASNKPLRATLYEEDGYTEYIWNKRREDGTVQPEGEIYADKKSYTQNISQSEADGTEIYDGDNYPTFPIVPLWGNEDHQSELVGIREQIDAYDLIKSGFCNTIDEASYVYWTIANNGGVDDVDLAQFVERIKTVHAANLAPDANAEAHTVEAPSESREALLDRIKSDLYDDYMALDVKNIASGATTATQIRAAYEPLNNKCDDFEYQIHNFLDGILAVIGVEDDATFTRSMMVNVQEEITSLVQAAQFLDESYVTTKILTILGDADKAEDVLKQMDADDIERLGGDETEVE